MNALAYTLAQAAEVAPISIDVLRRATRTTTTDPAAFPQPLKAKRLGTGPNAKTIILADELRAWLDTLPDA